MTLQPAAVLFPDVELWGSGYLRTALVARSEPYAANVFVGNNKPTSTTKTRIVVLRRDGGAARGVLDFPRLTVRIWASVEQEASDLARLVCALLVASPGNGPVVAAEQLSGPLGVPDAAGPQKLATIQLATRGGNL